MKIIKLTLVMAVMIALTATAQGVVIMGNWGTGSSDSASYTDGQAIAVGFTMGGTGYTLQSIEVGVASSSAPTMALWSSSGGGSPAPSASLLALSSPTGSSGDWTATGTFSLASGTSYFVVVSGGGGGTWDIRGTTYTASGASYMNNAMDLGSGWISGVVSPALAMNINAVPEPQEYAMLAGLCLLGFAAIRRKLAAKVG
jgi:hypothetical protein